MLAYAHIFTATRHHRSSLDTREQPGLYIIEDGVVLNDGEVLHLAEELLVRVDTRAEHLLLCRAHLAHLLCHLVGSYERGTVSVGATERRLGICQARGIRGSTDHCHSQGCS